MLYYTLNTGASEGLHYHLDLRGYVNSLNYIFDGLEAYKVKVFQHKLTKFWILYLLRISADKNYLPKRYKAFSVFSG